MENESAQNPEAKADVTPASSPENQTPPTASSGAQDAGSQSQQDNRDTFASHPRFREVLEQNRTFKKELAQLRQQYEADRQRSQAAPQGQPLSPEDEEQLVKLFSLASRSPKVLSALGLDKLGNFEKQLSELNENWSGSQFEAEFSGVTEEAKKYGIDPNTLRDEIEQVISEHPVYSQIGYKKGAVKAIFRDLYWDRIGELKERAANKQRIEKQAALKAGQTQNPNASSAPGSKPIPASQRVMDMIKQAGGLGGIDWNA